MREADATAGPGQADLPAVQMPGEHELDATRRQPDECVGKVAEQDAQVGAGSMSSAGSYSGSRIMRSAEAPAEQIRRPSMDTSSAPPSSKVRPPRSSASQP